MKLPELSEKELAELEKTHEPSPHYYAESYKGPREPDFCYSCAMARWPCRMARLLDEVRRNRARQGVLL